MAASQQLSPVSRSEFDCRHAHAHVYTIYGAPKAHPHTDSMHKAYIYALHCNIYVQNMHAFKNIHTQLLPRQGHCTGVATFIPACCVPPLPNRPLKCSTAQPPNCPIDESTAQSLSNQNRQESDNLADQLAAAKQEAEAARAAEQEAAEKLAAALKNSSQASEAAAAAKGAAKGKQQELSALSDELSEAQVGAWGVGGLEEAWGKASKGRGRGREGRQVRGDQGSMFRAVWVGVVMVPSSFK